MRNEILKKVALDLLFVPALTFREIRKKLIKTTLADIPADITPLHFEIMGLLNEEGTMHAAEIGNRLLIAKAQMTQLIDKLVATGIVSKETDSNDRRTTNITLTESGKNLLEEQFSNLLNSMEETMAVLSDEELEQLSVSLSTIRDTLSKLN